MLDSIEKHISEIKRLCSKFNVSKLEVFGSSLTDKFDPDSSDIDFLVEFKPLEQGQYADAYFGLLEAIKKLLDRNVDMVMTKAIKNPYFLQEIKQKRQIVYAA
jgi:predicted nucleotidyltransferase